VLKRPPRGYDADHPMLDDLKRKDFIATTSFADADVLAKGFLDQYAGTLRAAKPFMGFLARALALPL
jgi:uncharacterized protein (DUF2461 family)